MLQCPECGGNMQYIGRGVIENIGRFETFKCIDCRSTYIVDDPTELSEVERALVQEALHGQRSVVIDDEPPNYVPKWEDFGSGWD